MSSAADSDTNKMKILATLLIGVAIVGVASGENDQSELTIPDEGPMVEQGREGKRRVTPEVVLQLKYDGGELNRIYLTQFRKPKKVWNPSVTVQTNLCADLCHAGLGGDGCGYSCSQLLPVGLKTALKDGNSSVTEVAYGQPRVAVCPALCNNYLGLPLCQCTNEKAEDDIPHLINWTEVCQAFCTDGYALSGCLPCDATEYQTVATFASFRALSTAAGWQSWCNVQCPQGNGGLACNCDRSPFQ